VSTTTGWPAGFWWSELTHPYFHLTEAGYQVEVFSPNSGPCVAPDSQAAIPPPAFIAG
jgi:putative intracellular protease/amidase